MDADCMPLRRHRWPHALALAAGCAAAALLGGCVSGIRSSRLEAGKAADAGLVYFLPDRDVVVTVVSVKDKGSELTVAASDAMPDPKAAYLATIPRNHTGTVDSTLAVNDRGLLDSDSSTSVTSSVADILSKLAVARDLPFRGAERTDPKVDCSLPGTYRVTIPLGELPAEPVEFCDYRIEVQPSPARADLPLSVVNAGGKAQPGLFYRIPVPYDVTLTGHGSRRTYVVLSPTGSPTYFLPLAGSTFAASSGTLGFKDGVPTRYRQNIGNETVGLLSIPATVLQNYFAAVGAMFTVRKDAGDKEAAYLNQLNTLAVSEARRAACAKVAAESNDVEEIKKACSN